MGQSVEMIWCASGSSVSLSHRSPPFPVPVAATDKSALEMGYRPLLLAVNHDFIFVKIVWYACWTIRRVVGECFFKELDGLPVKNTCLVHAYVSKKFLDLFLRLLELVRTWGAPL